MKCWKNCHNIFHDVVDDGELRLPAQMVSGQLEIADCAWSKRWGSYILLPRPPPSHHPTFHESTNNKSDIHYSKSEKKGAHCSRSDNTQ